MNFSTIKTWLAGVCVLALVGCGGGAASEAGTPLLGGGGTTASSATVSVAVSSSLITTASKGADVKSVMSLLNSTGFAVVSLASAGIRKPKDLEGKSLAVSPGDPLGQLFRALAAHNKLDLSTIKFVQVDPAAKVVSVLEKKVDALLGGADDQFFLIKYKGVEPHALRYADHGANIVGMTIMTTGNLIKTKPDLVRRFVRASVRSWDEARKNPQAAVDAAMKVKPDLNRQSTLDQMMVDFELMDSANSRGKVGMAAQADWDQTISLLKQYRDLDTKEPWTTFHTNEFLPK